MEPAGWERVKELFHAASGLDPEARDQLLAGEPDEVRAEVLELVKSHAEAPPDEGPGAVIGRYKLLQEIGEGGFGVVYMAEQTEPVRRKVAVKVLKAGMDSRPIVARFEAERQALALMDHPNIARVLDGGATLAGRPYFVMELVKGVPVTEYCDGAGLGTQERLELFQQVCHAVQHAHQKGIIHRDLKPSNVLVTLHDGRPVPKVIDFGIAKALDQRLTDKTLFTEFHQMIGTPEYMAPEQAEMSGLDVDTRADIYSLGVLLYELLTGTKPFDLKDLMARGYAEVLRTIREVDPPRPSTRVSTLGELLPTVARRRHTQPRLLGRVLRGDLDWIVMRALEKDRARRYDTANAFAMDIGRYLNDETVFASPPTAAYRLRKYVRRHRVGVAAAAAILVVLVAGLVAAALGYREAEAARAAEARQRKVAEERAREAQTEAEKADETLRLVQALLSPDPLDPTKGPDLTVRELVEDFDRSLGDSVSDKPEIEAHIRLILGNALAKLDLAGRAKPHYERAYRLAREHLPPEHPLVPTILRRYAMTHGFDLGRRVELLREALALLEAKHGSEHRVVVLARAELGPQLVRAGHVAEGAELAYRALPILRKHGGTMALSHVLSLLAEIERERERFEEAERLLRECIEQLEARVGRAGSGNYLALGWLLARRGDLPGALAAYDRALELETEAFGADGMGGSIPLVSRAEVKGALGDWDGAVQDALWRGCASTFRMGTSGLPEFETYWARRFTSRGTTRRPNPTCVPRSTSTNDTTRSRTARSRRCCTTSHGCSCRKTGSTRRRVRRGAPLPWPAGARAASAAWGPRCATSA